MSQGCRMAGMLLLIMLAAVSCDVQASCKKPGEYVDVAVGIRHAPPFITHDEIRGRSGLGIVLWRSIQNQLQRDNVIGKTQYIECSLHDQLEALQKGELDVVISPLTVTADRLADFEFTHQYLASGITVAQKRGNTIRFARAWSILKETVTRPGVPLSILVFILINMVLAVLVARALRSHVDFEVINHESRFLRVVRIFLETICRTTGLLEMSSEFRSTLSKMLDATMSVIGIMLSATIFGVLAAAMIGSIGSQSSVSLEELVDMRVVTLGNSTSMHFLEDISRGWDGHFDAFDNQAGAEGDAGATAVPGPRRRLLESAIDADDHDSVPAAGDSKPIRCQPADEASEKDRCITATSWSRAMRLLADGRADAILGDWAQLSYLANQPGYADSITVQSEVFRNEPYGWGINAKRPELRLSIDRALMSRLRNPQWRSFVQQYLGSDSSGAN